LPLFALGAEPRSCGRACHRPRRSAVSSVFPRLVFGPEGEDVSSRDEPYSLQDNAQIERAGSADEALQQYRRKYKDQVVFVNKMLRKAIDGILRNSATPPIIIVQGDHGPGSLRSKSMIEEQDDEEMKAWERFSILNAYYFPFGGSSQLYPTITPVNTFRVMLRYYFGAKLDLVAPRMIWSDYDHVNRFKEASYPSSGRYRIRGAAGNSPVAPTASQVNARPCSVASWIAGEPPRSRARPPA